MLRARIVEDALELTRLAPAWDELANAGGCPGALSSWQLAWWRHCAPVGAQLRAVLVEDEGRLVGLAPFWLDRGRAGTAAYRLLAASITHRVEPVCDPDRVGEVATAVAQALAGATPSPDYVAFEAADARGRWQSAVAAAWPGRRPRSLHERELPAPILDLPPGGFDAWMNGKSRNFRQQMRRARRRLADAGGQVRMSRTAAELDRDIDAFMRLHHERWDARGGSTLGRGVGPMLHEAGRALLATERFRLWVVEVGGQPVSAQLFLAAGGTVVYWNGGFDPAAANLKPALVGILAGLEDCFARGERRLDLGGGAHDYKLRFADGDLPLVWGGLVPRDRRYLRNRVALLPRQSGSVARALFRALPPAAQRRARELLRER